MELSPTEWIYSDFMTYVITHNEISSTEQICFINENPIDVVEKLKAKDGKNIWICGGANLAQQLMHNDLIDQYYIFCHSNSFRLWYSAVWKSGKRNKAEIA